MQYATPFVVKLVCQSIYGVHGPLADPMIFVIEIFELTIFDCSNEPDVIASYFSCEYNVDIASNKIINLIFSFLVIKYYIFIIVMINNYMATLDSKKQEIFEYVLDKLGRGMVDVELDPSHLEMAYKKAIRTYRGRASNAEEESYVFLDVVKDVQDYILPEEVSTVRQIFRRTIGATGENAGDSFEPFQASFVSSYLLTAANGMSGSLLTFDLYKQFQTLTAMMFGAHVLFTFNPVTKKLSLVRRPTGDLERMMLWVYNMKPEIYLVSDPKIVNWIMDYTYSTSKFTLGEARSKFNQINGPQGGTSLNGNDLKAEAKEEIALLMEDLRNLVDNSAPLSFIIG